MLGCVCLHRSTDDEVGPSIARGTSVLEQEHVVPVEWFRMGELYTFQCCVNGLSDNHSFAPAMECTPWLLQLFNMNCFYNGHQLGSLKIAFALVRSFEYSKFVNILYGERQYNFFNELYYFVRFYQEISIAEKKVPKILRTSVQYYRPFTKRTTICSSTW